MRHANDSGRDAVMTHEEIAKVLGIPRSTVREIEASALRKLRREMKKRRWQGLR